MAIAATMFLGVSYAVVDGWSYTHTNTHTRNPSMPVHTHLALSQERETITEILGDKNFNPYFVYFLIAWVFTISKHNFLHKKKNSFLKDNSLALSIGNMSSSGQWFLFLWFFFISKCYLCYELPKSDLKVLEIQKFICDHLYFGWILLDLSRRCHGLVLIRVKGKF